MRKKLQIKSLNFVTSKIYIYIATSRCILQIKKIFIFMAKNYQKSLISAKKTAHI